MAGRLAGRPADEIQVIFDFFKIHYRSKYEGSDTLWKHVRDL